MIGILDYGAGNIRSVINAFDSLGEENRLIDAASGLKGIDRLVVPGDGHFGTAMGELDKRGFIEPIRAWVAEDRPFLGICIGMQLLLARSEEAPGVRGLDCFPGSVKRFPQSGLKIPQMGWNLVRYPRASALFEGVRDGSYFYFIHGYYVEPESESISIGVTDYGIDYCSAIGKGRVFALQFHPEKSGASGMWLLENWLKL